MRQLVVSIVVVVAGTASTLAVLGAATSSSSDLVLFAAILLVGPAWALCFALASDDDDFASAEQPRGWWLRVLPWTFLTAPLVLPNVILLGMFIRDSRADGGRSVFSWDRMRPGEEDHHWPS